MHPISSRDENHSLSSTEEEANFPQAPQEEPSLRNRYVRGTLCFLPQVEWTPISPDSNKAGFPCSVLNAGSYFISQDEGMTESPVGTLEKAIVLHLFWTEGLTSFSHIEGCAEFIASKGADA